MELPTLRTQRLTIRQIVPSDWQAIHYRGEDKWWSEYFYAMLEEWFASQRAFNSPQGNAG